MIKLIHREKLGIEMFTVIYEIPTGEFIVKDFWSEKMARAFIGRRFPHLDLDHVGCESATRANARGKTNTCRTFPSVRRR